MIELLVLAAFILSLNAFVRARRATERVERDLQAVKEELAALRAAGGFPASPAAPAAPAVPADVALASSEAEGDAAVAPTLHDASAEAGDAPLGRRVSRPRRPRVPLRTSRPPDRMPRPTRPLLRSRPRAPRSKR